MANNPTSSSAAQPLPTGPLSPRQWAFLRLETKGTPAKLDSSSQFIKAQKDSIVSPTSKRVQQPHWARLIIAENGGYQEILSEAAHRALKTPDEATLVEVHAVLNDIGRDPKAADQIRKVLTQENLDRIFEQRR